jgi:hypothetical protein
MLPLKSRINTRTGRYVSLSSNEITKVECWIRDCVGIWAVAVPACFGRWSSPWNLRCSSPFPNPQYSNTAM